MILQQFKYRYLFSIFNKIPKNVKVQEPNGWLSRLFRSSENSPSYILLKQLFTYLQNSVILKNQFPFLKNNIRFQQSWMIMHVILLRNRTKNQKSISRSEVQLFNYNLKTYFFPQYASYTNPLLPVQRFANHYSQSYFKRLQIYDQQVNEHVWNLVGQKIFLPQSYNGIFKKLIFQNRLDIGSPQVIKFSKYYLAHKRYLNMLSWSDIMEYKVRWGFDGQVKAIQNLVKDTNIQ